MGVVRFVKVEGVGVGCCFFSMFGSGVINISCLRLLGCSQKGVCTSRL